ncbi:MAG: BrnT family toxin, partial [Chloroflexota bacterium]
VVRDDTKHSHREKRYYCLGQTNANRWLFVAFTFRKNKIRVISARDMSPKERRVYARTNP